MSGSAAILIGMDSGLAVILGAVIALAGSSLIPWWRESREAHRARVERRVQERDDALVELLAKNAYFGMATTLSETNTVSAAFEARSRAATRLLLLSDDVAERRALADVLNSSLPLSGKGSERGAVGIAIAALQDVLIRWSAGAIPTAELSTAYDKLVARDPSPKKSG